MTKIQDADRKKQLNSFSITNNASVRFMLARCLAIVLAVAYILFMVGFAEGRLTWFDYHAQRIFNAVEFLRINGYFSHYGYSIWTSCKDCDVSLPMFKDEIYLTVSALKLFPFALLNELGGKTILFSIGNYLDLFIIMASGMMLSERLSFIVRHKSIVTFHWVYLSSFMLFLLAPWTYKMMKAPWPEVYFLFFYFLSLIYFEKKKNILGFSFLSACSFFSYQWGFMLGIYFGATYLLRKIYTTDSYRDGYSTDTRELLKRTCAVMIPALIELVTRIFAASEFTKFQGSSLLVRIGISGDDPHNGSILGALQFLGGQRVSTCIPPISEIEFGALEMLDYIGIYNCGLSILSIFLISVFSIYIFCKFISQHSHLQESMLPLAFSLMMFVFIFQQSLSVHLLGYSYIFSTLVTVSWVIFIFSFMKSNFSNIRLVLFSSPILAGILLAFIHINQFEKIQYATSF